MGGAASSVPEARAVPACGQVGTFHAGFPGLAPGPYRYAQVLFRPVRDVEAGGPPPKMAHFHRHTVEDDRPPRLRRNAAGPSAAVSYIDVRNDEPRDGAGLLACRDPPPNGGLEHGNPR